MEGRIKSNKKGDELFFSKNTFILIIYLILIHNRC